MRRAVHKGLRHVALRVTNLARSRAFYEALLGMQVVWEPDADNVYLSSGTDNLALHQISAAELDEKLGDRVQAMMTKTRASEIDVARLVRRMLVASRNAAGPTVQARE